MRYRAANRWAFPHASVARGRSQQRRRARRDRLRISGCEYPISRSQWGVKMAKERSFDTLDIIKEVVNIGVGDAAAALSDLVKGRVVIRVPELTILDMEDVPEFIANGVSSLGVYISQDFSGFISGRVLLFYTKACSFELLACLTGHASSTSTMTLTEIATLQEVGNIIMVSCISTICNVLKGRVDFRMPQVTEEISKSYFQNMVEELTELDKAVIVRSEMAVRERNISGYIFVLLSFADFEVLAQGLAERTR